MNELQIFQHERFGKVRTMMKDGQPWFVASDVAKALGYENPSRDVQRHCKKVNKINQATETVGGQIPPVNFNIIPESDVYRLVMRSNMPEAEKFQDWVCEEVLPAIRKHGAYALPSPAFDVPQSYPAALRLAANLYEKNELLLLENGDLKSQVESLGESLEKAAREKSRISGRREGTALRETRRAKEEARRTKAEADAFRDRLGMGFNAMSVDQIPWLDDRFCMEGGKRRAVLNAAGRALTYLCIKEGYPFETRRAHGSSYNVYDARAVDRFLEKLDEDPAYCAKNRRRDGGMKIYMRRPKQLGSLLA